VLELAGRVGLGVDMFVLGPAVGAFMLVERGSRSAWPPG
jgi:hypothetical protein